MLGSIDGADYASSTFQAHPDSVDVIIRDFSIAIVDKKDPSRRKDILHPINTVVDGGTMFAILGGSGSGKTTLLNVIAGRYSAKQLHVEGEVRFGALRKCTVGYVTQQDFLMPHLTVRETLQFAARLKVDPRTPVPVNSRNKASSNGASGKRSESDRMYDCIVSDVIQELGLRECADSMVGESSGTSNMMGGNRGLSGGERRRVSIAVQIISDAKVLCADEPTSGLDSFTAITVIEALHRLTRGPHHTTVIASVHQPRADVFHMFDTVLLLTKGGHAIYCGTTKAMVGYFRNLGYDCPANSNPADYYVDISSVDNQNAAQLQQSRTRVTTLVAAFNEFQLRMCLSVGTVPSDEPSSPMSKSRDHSRSGKHVTGFGDADRDRLEYRAPWAQQVRLLLARFVTNNRRDASNILGGLLQAAALGLIVMGIFWQLSDSVADIETRNGLLYITVSVEYYITTIILVERFCAELKVFDRELQDALYQPSAYLTAHLLSSAPLLLLPPLLYATPIYFGCNLRHGAAHYFMFAAVNVALTCIVNGMVWMCVSITRDFTLASLLANMNFTFISLTAGFLVNYHDIPEYVKWVRYLSFCSYGYRILMSNEYSDRVLPGCPSSDPADCGQYDGNAILDSQDIAVDDYAGTWPCLLALCLCYHGIAYANLHFLRFPVTGIVGSDITIEDTAESRVANKTDSNTDSPVHTNGSSSSPVAGGTAAGAAGGGLGLGFVLEEGSQTLLQGDEFSRASVSIQVSGVHLLVRSAGPLPLPQPGDEKVLRGSGRDQALRATGPASKMILSDISADIQPGRLVALMGGSGSGKTTLLNLIAGRIPTRCLGSGAAGTGGIVMQPSSLLRSCLSDGSQYEGCGEILFNGRVPTSAKLRELIGYVQQFDFHLPSLTVRETLLFHANMRLPRSMEVYKRQQRVQQVLTTLDLHACANTRVGDAELKGISGGEKRRLSLGVQLLADPAVCLLDEPTTGLDAFTARQVVRTLQQLAHKGRTVVVSIHQPRYDVFALLDDVILLSRGRLVWAGSSADMLKHFGALGHPCPALTNPADFILDISSIDFRSEEKEAASRACLDALLLGQQSYRREGLSVRTYAQGFDFDDESGSECDPDASQQSRSALGSVSSPGRHGRGMAGSSSSTLPRSATAQSDDPFGLPRIDEQTAAETFDKLRALRIESSPDEGGKGLVSPTAASAGGPAAAGTGKERRRTLTSDSTFTTAASAAKPLYFTLPLLLHRSFLNMSRQPALCANRISQGAFYGLILACFYAPIGDDQNSIQNRIGSLYETTALMFIGMLSCIAIYPTERNVFYREYVDGDYSVLSFFLAYYVIAVPFIMTTAVIIAALLTYAVGLRAEPHALLIFSCVVFNFIFTGECVGVIFCSLFTHVGFSVNVMSVVLSLFGIMAGYISIDMPQALRYVSYLAPTSWGCYVLSNVVFQQKTFTCYASERDSQGNCPFSTGEQVLALYDMDGADGRYGLTFHMYMLAVVTVSVFLLSFLVLRARGYRLSH